MNKWVIRRKKGNKQLLSETMGVSDITAQILINRGLLREDVIDEFLETSITKLDDFTKAHGVFEGIELLCESIANDDKITIYGDYDVDGVTSSTILYKTISFLTDNVEYFLPNRHKDGYGLNIKRIDELIDSGTNLIITCDNGIASVVENDYIQRKGLKHIVIDHHEEPKEKDKNLLEPNVMIDPKQKICKYEFKEMCAAGLSYRFSVELLKSLNKRPDFLDEILVFAMIGTICDIVPLFGDNRIIVKEGLEIFNNNLAINKGLEAILFRKDVLDKVVTTYTVGFIIGPTINSAGRLLDGHRAVDLFTTSEKNQLEDTADLLYNLNLERQNMTKESTEESIEIIENNDLHKNSVIIIHNKNCDEAVAGIVSGRIKEKYNKPTMMVTGEGILKASCRSTSNYDMHQELSKVSEYFIKFGGHKMAAGFSLEEDKFEAFKKAILENCSLRDEDFVKIIGVDDILEFEQINFKEAMELDILKPYGEGNQQPLFATTNIKVSSLRVIEDKNTLIFGFKNADETVEHSAITFSLFDKFVEIIETNFEPFIAKKILNGVIRDIDLIFDIVYYIGINEFRGNKKVQLQLVDFRLSKNA